jgi:hypothetical protein
MAQGVQPKSPRGMAALSRSFYEIAHEFTVAMSRGDAVQFIKYTSGVVILLHSCLEAYLNEFLATMRQMDSQRWAAAISPLDRADLKRKWLQAPLIFGTHTFEKNAEPFQSFHLLVSLRNELVHYDPRFRTPEEFPSKKIKALKTKFAFAYEGRADWTTQVLTVDCARWGCRTVKNMVQKLHEYAGGTDMSAWPHPGQTLPDV